MKKGKLSERLKTEGLYLYFGERTTVRKGGSLQITIPSVCAELMGLVEGQPMEIRYDPSKEEIIIIKSSAYRTGKVTEEKLSDGSTRKVYSPTPEEMKQLIKDYRNN